MWPMNDDDEREDVMMMMKRMTFLTYRFSKVSLPLFCYHVLSPGNSSKTQGY